MVPEYTDEQIKKLQDRSFAEGTYSLPHSRIKQEHAELLEALKLAMRIIPRAWMPAAPVTYAEWDSAFEKIEALIAKVEK